MNLAACVVALLAGLDVTAAAHAHGFVDRTTPAAGSTVRGSPAEVKMWFSQAVEPAFSTMQVLDKSGKKMDQKDIGADAADPTLLRVSLPPLAPGTYRVNWRVLSRDGHVTKGSFTFDVAP
jgi:methionine-rich copper-binding protein CopC